MANNINYFIGITFALIMVSFITNMAMDKIAISEGIPRGTSIFDYETSQMRDFDTTGNYSLTTDVIGSIPNSQNKNSVDEEQGGFFSDIFGTMRSWIELIPGVRFITGIVNTLPNFLSLIFQGELQPIAFALGYMWFGLFVFAIIVWLKGGN
jgi:hypothetical protein